MQLLTKKNITNIIGLRIIKVAIITPMPCLNQFMRLDLGFRFARFLILSIESQTKLNTSIFCFFIKLIDITKIVISWELDLELGVILGHNHGRIGAKYQTPPLKEYSASSYNPSFTRCILATSWSELSGFIVSQPCGRALGLNG
jgi:hypothetical protein